MVNLFERTYVTFENDIDDFKMPYKHYGKTDLEIMIKKYNSLSNEPKYLEIRFLKWYE